MSNSVPNFIPKPYRKDPVMVRIDIDRLKKIDELAVKYDLSRSGFINRCIEFALQHMVSEDVK